MRRESRYSSQQEGERRGIKIKQQSAHSNLYMNRESEESVVSEQAISIREVGKWILGTSVNTIDVLGVVLITLRRLGRPE